VGNRFGRNQKRRMRAEIASAQERAAAASEVVTIALRSQQRTQEALDYVLEALAGFRESALVPATTVALEDQDPHGPLQWDMTPDFQERAYGDLDALLETRGLGTYRVEQLYAIHWYVDQAANEMARTIHFFCAGSGKYAGRWAYRISDRALGCGLHPHVRRDFAVRIATELLDGFDQHLKAARHA
jgi:hypothetical protein